MISCLNNKDAEAEDKAVYAAQEQLAVAGFVHAEYPVGAQFHGQAEEIAQPSQHEQRKRERRGNGGFFEREGSYAESAEFAVEE